MSDLCKAELRKFTAKTVIIDKDDLIYDGTEKTVEVEVLDSKDKSDLTEDVDYILSYGSNIDAGTAKIMVIGIGDYTGTKTLRFTIRPANDV